MTKNLYRMRLTDGNGATCVVEVESVTPRGAARTAPAGTRVAEVLVVKQGRGWVALRPWRFTPNADTGIMEIDRDADSREVA